MGMDIFTSISGFRVTSTEVWERTRKREIYALFENLVYGAAPIGRPDDMEFSVEEIHREHSILQKKITITFMVKHIDSIGPSITYKRLFRSRVIRNTMEMRIIFRVIW